MLVSRILSWFFYACAAISGLLALAFGALLLGCEDDWCFTRGFRAWILLPLGLAAVFALAGRASGTGRTPR